jgi:hypothetical protein
MSDGLEAAAGVAQIQNRIWGRWFDPVCAGRYGKLTMLGAYL